MYFVLVNIHALEIPGDREEQIRPVKMLKLNEKVQKQLRLQSTTECTQKCRVKESRQQEILLCFRHWKETWVD